VSPAQCPVDDSPNTLRIAEHFRIPKAKNTITFLLNGGGSYRVLFGFVLPAVYFANELCTMTRKIDDEVADRNLPTKVMLVKTLAENQPKFAFCSRHVRSQSACSRQ